MRRGRRRDAAGRHGRRSPGDGRRDDDAAAHQPEAGGQGGWNLFCASAVESDILTPATHYALRGNGDQAQPGWPTSPRIEALCGQRLDASDPAEEKRLAAALQAQAFGDVPCYPLGFCHRPTAHRADLAGVLDDIPAFWNVRRT